MRIVCAVIILYVFLINTSYVQSSSLYPLIPYPQELIPRHGRFNMTAKTAIVAGEKIFSNEVQQLRELIGLNLKVQTAEPKSNFISFRIDPSIVHEEGYVLDISSSRISIDVSTPTGLFRALQSLRQLSPVSLEKAKTLATISIPCAHIKDYP